ncbi:MAG: XRE family transcriptional regulator [Clostridia bacterium]|nr:XRE family transcriptional regulator [Clostridia bacterium]
MINEELGNHLKEYVCKGVELLEKIEECIATGKQVTSEWTEYQMICKRLAYVMDTSEAAASGIFVEAKKQKDRRKAKIESKYVTPQRIKEQLIKNCMSQRELADTIGTTEVSISRYVSGERVPKAPLIAKMAKALNCTCDELLY